MWTLTSMNIIVLCFVVYGKLLFFYISTDNTTGEKYVGEQDTILLEVVKQLSESEASLKTLRQQMRTGNNGENFSFVEHQIEQSLETDLQCNICYELFIKVILLIRFLLFLILLIFSFTYKK